MFTCSSCGETLDERAIDCPACGTAVAHTMRGAVKAPAADPALLVAERADASGVVIRGLDVPFGDLVFLLVKLAIAAIPAAIIVTLIMAVVWGVLGGILSAGI